MPNHENEGAAGCVTCELGALCEDTTAMLKSFGCYYVYDEVSSITEESARCTGSDHTDSHSTYRLNLS